MPARLSAEVIPVFFLVRCVFWLSIVFSSMAWTPDPRAVDAAQPHALRDAVVQGGFSLAGVAKDAALDEAKAWCVNSPRQCLADAGQLTALVAANQAEDLSEPVGDEVYPLPPANPSRHPAPRG